LDKQQGVLAPDDKCSTEDACANSGEDKMRALKQYCRARGLCDCCTEKWKFGHKCAPTVQLQVIQEMWELFLDNENSADSASLQSTKDTTQLCLCLSQATTSGVESPKSMRLIGHIQGHKIVMLLDSTSSHTFVNSGLAFQLSGISSLPKPLQVQVTDGARVTSDTQLLDAEWTVQGYKFYSNFKVLHLQHFDVILDNDWLEQFNPMKVHWLEKWIAIPY
jgi:hypothetical protein